MSGKKGQKHYPQSIKDEINHRRREKYPVAVMCRFFNASRSGYYDYVKRRDKGFKDILTNQRIWRYAIHVKTRKLLWQRDGRGLLFYSHG